jgi:hypothetical protein
LKHFWLGNSEQGIGKAFENLRGKSQEQEIHTKGER